MKFFNRIRKRGGARVEPPEKPPVLDNRTLLKHARLCIDGRRLDEAQKYCKKILRKDKNNYMALILLGKSFKTNESAVITYEKALQIRPDHPLAWQGLAEYYEHKTGIDAENQLLGIYEKILILQNIEEGYIFKILHKYGQISYTLKYAHSINILMQYMSKGCNVNLIKTAEEQLLKILHEVKCKDEDLPETIEFLKIMSVKHPSDEKLQSLLAELMFRKYDFAAAAKEIIELEIFSGSILMKEMICEDLCRKFIAEENFGGFEIEHHLNKLTRGIEGTRYAEFLSTIMMYKNGNKVEAFQKCIDFVKNANFEPIPEAFFLLNCSKVIGDISLTENLTSALLRNPCFENSDVIYLANITLLNVYLNKGRCYETLNVLKKIPIGIVETELLMSLGDMYCKEFLDVNMVKKILTSTDYLDLFKVFDHIKYKKYRDAITILRSYNKHPVKYYYLSYAYWQSNQYALCLENLQRALELLPDVPKIYLCLGIYYYEHENNIEEGRKHLEKSYRMCATDTETIKILSVIYDQLKLVDFELNLLQNSVGVARETKQFWIYTRLGRLYFVKGNTNDAIKWLSEGVKGNPKDVTAHEWIGDSYFTLQSYDQAITAYEKVVAITNNTPLIVKNCLKIGCIYTLQELPNQAIFMYNNVLRVEPKNALAVRGVIKSRLTLAQRHFFENSYSAAREEVQAAVNFIVRGMSIDVTNADYMHFFGDCLLFISRLSDEHCYIKLQNSEGETQKSGKIAMYQMAIESYSNVAKLRDSFALYKCANTYFLYYFETKHISFCHTSYNLAVLCVKTNSNAWRYWDLLGKVCYFLQKYEMAHYSFFRAISLNENQTVSKIWCNLGVLYLKIEKERLANYCFAVGRDYLPSYPRAWIGDGLLADIIQEEGNIGVFTPAPNVNIQLLNEDYVDWLNMINEMFTQEEPSFSSPIEAFRNIPNSIEIIEWYLSFEQETAWGCAALGHIQENKGMLNRALSYYQRAYAMADEEQKPELLFHKARVLMKMTQYNEAIRVFSGTDELNLRAAIGLANALLKAKYDEDAFIAYHIALTEHCIHDRQRIKILITMSNVGYRMKGLRFGYCVMQQAERVQRVSQGRGFDIPFLKSYVFGKVYDDLVLYLMKKKLHEHMDEAMWWYYLGVNHLKRTNKYAKVACMYIRMAIQLGKNSEHYDVIGKMHALISIAEFYGGDKDAALNYAKNALKIYPEQQELWAALILCVFSHREWPYRVAWILTTLYNVRLSVSLSRPIKEWLISLERKLLRI